MTHSADLRMLFLTIVNVPPASSFDSISTAELGVLTKYLARTGVAVEKVLSRVETAEVG